MEPSTPYAGIVTRGLAFGLDAAILNVGFVAGTAFITLVLSVFDAVPKFNANVAVGSVVGWSALAIVYFSCFWVLMGQTPGMRWMGLEVEREGGGRIRWGRAFRRLVGMVLAAIPLMMGYALILFDGHRRGLHDRIAGTVVRYGSDREPLARSER